MKYIRLVNSDARATVDDDDYDRLAGFEWRLRARNGGTTFYAYRNAGRQQEQMERTILGPPPEGMVWDHRNGNGLDNRRANLRPATPLQNTWNARKQCRPGASQFKSPFKGVSKCKGRWHAAIRIGGRKVHLGSFPTAQEAAAAYDQAARRQHGEFACVNFPRTGDERGCLA
jgi:hypothetical protein